MRSWYPIPVEELDNKRLLGEHLELHTMNSVILNNKKGYSRHPETIRWKGHTKAMKERHDAIEKEMCKRGFKPKSPMQAISTDLGIFPNTIEPLDIMWKKLKAKRGY